MALKKLCPVGEHYLEDAKYIGLLAYAEDAKGRKIGEWELPPRDPVHKDPCSCCLHKDRCFCCSHKNRCSCCF